jgi:hypothetical protein
MAMLRASWCYRRRTRDAFGTASTTGTPGMVDTDDDEDTTTPRSRWHRLLSPAGFTGAALLAIIGGLAGGLWDVFDGGDPAPPPDGTLSVTAHEDGEVYAEPFLGAEIIGAVADERSYEARCWTYGEMDSHPLYGTHNFWVLTALPDGKLGYVHGLHLKGDERGHVPWSQQCG